MSSKNFSKANVDMFLFELAKAYKKQNKHAIPIEIVIVGGASILLKYNFRETTTDIDAILSAKTSLLDAAKTVQEKFELSDDWINTDFTRTKSYSHALVEHSKYYKTFCDILSVRTVEDEYLFAMKLASFRQYKRDLSDLVGIAKEMQEKQMPLSFDKIDQAVKELYTDWTQLPFDSKEMAKNIVNCNDLEELYYTTIALEEKTKTALLQAEKEYPEKINEKIWTILLVIL